MTWDVTTPVGTEGLKQGDNRIRELKVDIAAALTAQGSFPGADTANPRFIWTPESGDTAARPTTPLVTGQLYINTQTGTIQRYNGATWDDILSVADGAITAAKLAAAIAGAGLSGGAGTALSVNVDNSTIECPVDTLQVKDAGITAAKLAAAVAGDGLTNNGTGLVVNVDGSTIETNSDALRVKDAGITEPKLAAAVVNKLGQNLGLVARVTRSSNGDLLNYTGQGRLRGIGGAFGLTAVVEVIVDGTSLGTVTLGGGDCSVQYNDGGEASMFKAVAGAGQVNELDVAFRTSIRIVLSSYGGAGNVCASYERQA